MTAILVRCASIPKPPDRHVHCPLIAGMIVSGQFIIQSYGRLPRLRSFFRYTHIRGRGVLNEFQFKCLDVGS